jgi:hypothetical protein
MDGIAADDTRKPIPAQIPDVSFHPQRVARLRLRMEGAISDMHPD